MRIWRLLLCASLCLVTAAVPAQAQSEPSDAGSNGPAPAEDLNLSAFVGDWSHHGIVLRIQDDGSAQALWRVYQWCGPGVPEPCDRIESGSRLISGGRADLFLAPTAPDVAEGEVTASNDQQQLAMGPFTLRLQPYGMALFEQGDQALVLCGPRFLDEAPQDVIDTSPCGA